MDFQPVTSSNIRGAHYDRDTSTLTVQFTNGSRYAYSAVPADVYDDLITASSPGTYFADNVKGAYSYARVS
jgi:hypothetical protein